MYIFLQSQQFSYKISNINLYHRTKKKIVNKCNFFQGKTKFFNLLTFNNDFTKENYTLTKKEANFKKFIIFLCLNYCIQFIARNALKIVKFIFFIKRKHLIIIIYQKQKFVKFKFCKI